MRRSPLSSRKSASSTRMGTAEDRIIAALARHRDIPTSGSVASLARGLSPKQVLDAKKSNLRIKAAWEAKTIELVQTMSLSRMVRKEVAPILSKIPAAMARKRELMLCRIASYKKRPSLSHLVRYVTGGGNTEILRGDPEVERLAIAKLISLLRQMPDKTIRAQRLDRNAEGEVKKYLDQRFKRK